jgi:hypothetical protein
MELMFAKKTHEIGGRRSRVFFGDHAIALHHDVGKFLAWSDHDIREI